MNRLLWRIIIFVIFFFLASITIYIFIVPPKVIGISIKKENVQLNSPIRIDFNKPVKRKEIQHFITPNVYGEWKFENSLIRNHLFTTLVFVPAVGYQPDTFYHMEIKNITFTLGGRGSRNFDFDFRTGALSNKMDSDKNDTSESSVLSSCHFKKESPKITLLDIPLDWQDHPLSCEAACLKMALSFKGVHVSEEEIMRRIGYDRTPRRGNIWGDPYKNFVGSIDGRMCVTGYGVYWPAVAKVTNNWREAKAFTRWSIPLLVKEVENGNPVIVWGTLPVPYIHDCSWYTPGGKYIKAIREDHVRLVVGFIGKPENPLKIILNDPLSGRLYWTTSYFLTNWRAFGYSGVVIK